ncbi:MAG: adenosylcobinamide-GDP ribazoletransferase [Deltaproteobacteria bacterium]|nr:adenosylcobinamide-GDP ribazoletransferase [Deltaproteobacteria bacterium]
MNLPMRGLITAIRTLTAIPVGGRDTEHFSDSLLWFPPVGMLLGTLLWATGWAWNRAVGTGWPGGGAIILLVAEILLTRALHLDGLADWADAVGGSRDREGRLRIMRDPHLGSFGVVALVTDLLAKWVVMRYLLLGGGLSCIVPVFIVSRAMMAALMVRLPYARSGEGMASPFLEGISRGQGIAIPVLSFCLCLFFGPPGIVLYLAGWITAGLLGLSFKRTFGGITGDLLGTTNEVVETILLWLCALGGNLLLAYRGWGWLW